jgi:hypothetical protein
MGVRPPFTAQSRRLVSAIFHGMRRTRSQPLRVLFDAFNPMNIVCLRPMIDGLLARPDVRVSLMNSREDSLDTARAMFAAAGYAADRVVLAGPRTRWRAWDLYVCADHRSLWRSWLWLGAPRVYADHGISGARHPRGEWWELRPEMLPTYAAVFVSGELFLPAARAQARRAGCETVPRLIGFPKLDRLVDGSLCRARIAAQLRLDGTRPIVMFAPSWGPYSLGTLAFDAVMAVLLRDDRYHVIVKLHQLQTRDAPVEWRARLQAWSAHPSVRLVEDPDCLPYLSVADALVTDHSSIGFEFALLDRPLFQFDHLDLIFSPPELQELATRAAYRFADVGELPALLERGMRLPAERSAARRALAAACFYKPGTATERAVALLLALARGDRRRGEPDIQPEVTAWQSTEKHAPSW